MTGAQRWEPRSVLIAATTWWPAPARLACAFAATGLGVAALCPPGHPLRKVRAVGRLFPYAALRPVDALARAVVACAPDLLVPCDDRAAEHCAALHARGDEATRALVRRSMGAPESYRLFGSRHALLQAAMREGVRVPPTELARTAADADALGLPLPWVVKSSGSWGGAGIRVVRDRTAAAAAIRALSRPLGAARALKRLVVNRDGFWIAPWLAGRTPEVVVQGFVAGTPANIAVACDRGEVLAAIAVRVLRTQGPIGPAAVAEVVEHPEMLAAARRLARRLNLSGLHGLDFMLDAAGAAWLIEMNPRATQLCHIGGGASLAAALVGRLRGAPAPRAAPAPAGARVLFFPQAWRIDPASPLLRTAAHDVPWEEPALVEDLMLPPWPNRGRLARAWQAASGARDPNGAWAGAAPVAPEGEMVEAERDAPAQRPAAVPPVRLSA